MNLINKLRNRLRNHRVKDTGVYRLRLYHTWRTPASLSISYIQEDEFAFQKFYKPEGMTNEEMFKVISYICDLVYQNGKFIGEPAFSVSLVNDLLDFAGFTYLKNKDYKTQKSVDLFIVRGKKSYFKKSKHYKKYFNWYVGGVLKEDIEKIYNNLNVSFEVENILSYIKNTNKNL